MWLRKDRIAFCVAEEAGAWKQKQADGLRTPPRLEIEIWQLAWELERYPDDTN